MDCLLMQVDGFTATIFAGLFGLAGAAITHITTVMTSQRAADTELSVADKARNKELELKDIEVKHAIAMSKLTASNNDALAQKKFVQEIIQKTLEAGTVEEQIRNLRSYAKIGLIGEPYAERILKLEAQQLPTVGALERIIGDETHDQPVSYFNSLVSAADAVGLIKIEGSGGAQATGFLIGPQLLLTVNHVLPDIEAAKSALVSFSRESSAVGDDDFHQFQTQPSLLFVTNQALDYTLVAMKNISDGGKKLTDFGKIDTDSSSKIVVGQRVNVIHSSRSVKSISMRESKVVALTGQHLHYTAATSRGASGSPVLNDKFELLALHHASVPQTDEKGNIRMTDGTVFKGNSSAGINWIAKEGILWREIAKDLSRLSVSLKPRQRELLGQLIK